MSFKHVPNTKFSIASSSLQNKVQRESECIMIHSRHSGGEGIHLEHILVHRDDHLLLLHSPAT